MTVLCISDLQETPSPEHIPSYLWLLADSNREEMLHKVCELVLNNYCTISFNSQVDNDELAVDQVQLYASDVLTLGLLYTEFSDAIREGDGPRMIRCY